MITIRDVNTGAVDTLDGSEESMVKWHQDHPPMFYWVVRKVDKHTANIHIGTPEDGLHKEIAYVMTIDHNIDSVIATFDYKGWKLRDTDPYFPLYFRYKKDRLGMSDATIDYCLEHFPPNNYGFGMSFGICSCPELRGHHGYHVGIDVEYHNPHYADGRKFDTYANYDRPSDRKVPEPSKRELISLCEEVDVVIRISMNRELVPSNIIDKAVKFPYDERLIRLLKEVMVDEGEPLTQEQIMWLQADTRYASH